MKTILKYLLFFLATQCVASFMIAVGYLFFNGNGMEGVRQMVLAEGGIKFPAIVTILTSAVYSIVLLIVFLRRKWCVVSGNYINSRPWATLMWCGMFAVGALVPGSMLEEALGWEDVSGGALAEIVSSDYGFLVVCLFAPLVEEVVFRGAILSHLQKICKGRWRAILISAVLFSVVHMNPPQMPYAFLAGLFLGWIYVRTGSIVPGIVMHWVNNSIVYIICKAFPYIAMGSFSQFFGADGRSQLLALGFSLLIIAPSIYQLNRLTKRN